MYGGKAWPVLEKHFGPSSDKLRHSCDASDLKHDHDRQRQVQKKKKQDCHEHHVIAGDAAGEFTYTSPQGQSVVDYFLVSAQHLSSVTDMAVMRDVQYCNLSRDMPHDSEKSDHFPLQLDLSCSISTPNADTHTIPSQPSTRPQFKYVESQADAYQQCLTAELLTHLVPLLTGAVDIDNVVAILIARMVRAAQQTLPEKRKRSENNTFPRNPWFDAECKAAKKVKNRALHSDASESEKTLAVQHFRSVIAKVKAKWMQRRTDELCEMAKKDPQAFWKVFKTQQRDVCPVELAAQFEAFRALMGSQPAQIPEQAELLGTSVRAADASCLNASITSEELHDCIKRLKRNKSPGIDGVLSEMIKDGGDVLHNCLLVIFNLMLVNHFPKQLSVGLITAVYKSGDKGDMSNYRGITVGSVIAKVICNDFRSQNCSLG